MDGVLGSFFLIKPLFIYAATVDPPELFDLGNSLCNTTVYQRILGKVLLDGEDMNLEQIEAGLAWHYKYYQREQRAADRVWTGPEGTQPEWVERTLRWATVDLWQPVLEARGGTPIQRLLSEPRVMFLYLLAAAQYGYTPTILFNLGSFYFYAKAQGNQDYLETLQCAGYDGDKKMLGFLEMSYRTGRENWFYTANLLNAYIYMLSKDPSDAVYTQRAQKVLEDNRPRFAGHEDQLRALNAYETSLRKAMGGGKEDR